MKTINIFGFNKRIQQYSIVALLLLSFASCDDFLNETPHSQITGDIYNNPTTAQAALDGCYASVAGLNNSIYHLTLVTSSGLGITTNMNNQHLASLNYTSSDKTIAQLYGAFYRVICNSNDVINGMQNSTLADSIANKFEGEARFLRAVQYYNLVRIFAGVPLVTSPVRIYEEAQMPRATKTEVYKQIINDLDTAFLYMKSPEEQTKGYPHRYAAKAVLANVYASRACDLTYSHDKQDDATHTADECWQHSFDAAKIVVESKAYELIYPYAAAFGTPGNNSKESIFEVQFSDATTTKQTFTNVTIPRGYSGMPAADFSVGIWGRSSATSYLYETFDPKDPRREATFIDSLYHNTAMHGNTKPLVVLTYPFDEPTSQKYVADSLGIHTKYVRKDLMLNSFLPIKKYADPSYTIASNCNFTYMRYGELLLTYAEAANEISDPSVLSILNEVRTRAADINGNKQRDVNEISPTIVATADQDELRDIIMQERLHELAGEVDAWYTLRRRGEAFLKKHIEAHNAHLETRYGDRVIKYSVKYGTTNTDMRRNLLFPFPQQEINSNTAINTDEQNWGY